MTTTTVPATAPADVRGTALARRLLRGRADDPVWVRPGLLALLGATAVLYLWGLSSSGWANGYYSAAVQAAATSWKAFFFGSSDAANFITIDKAPAFLWPMAISARIFGVSSWSILVPQALEGVASVGVLYLAVRRWSGPGAGLLAGAVAALTPVAALMFRFNNPDALLVLLVTLAAYAVIRAVEAGSTRWIVLAGALVGFAFLAKMLQAFLVVPGFALVFLVAAPGPFWRRVRQLAAGGVAMVVAGGWWVAIVELWPASSRPYVGGSQDNSILNLIFGYNGFGRLTGEEAGSVGGGPAGTTGRWGETGLWRLFDQDYGGQASWLIPAALLLGGVLLALRWRAPRTDRVRAGALLWGSWLVVTGLAISLGEGIIHTYYTVALVPAIGALVGMGAVTLWRHRQHLVARYVAAGIVGVTAWWAAELLSRTPDWHPWLRSWVLGAGVFTAVALVVVGHATERWVVGALAATVLAVVLAGPAAYSLSTVSTGHTGALPTAGPSSGGFGGLGGPPGGGGGGGFPGGQPPQLDDGGGFPGNGGFPDDGDAGGFPSSGGFPGGSGGGGVGGILGASAPSDELTELLSADADGYTWVAAVVSANQAAGYQLATGEPVMAIGGFNGTDPAPSLEQFQDYVADGDIHYFVAGGMGFGGSNEIGTWVEENFEATTVGGVTVYDLTT